MAGSRPYSGDRGSTGIGWLLRIAVVISAVGVVGFDAASIGLTRLNLDDKATEAAIEARQTWTETGDVRRSYRTAVSTARRVDPDVAVPPDDFRIAADGTVTLKMIRPARTVLAQHVGLREHTVVTAVVTARPPTTPS
jgi:hypothetical protein